MNFNLGQAVETKQLFANVWAIFTETVIIYLNFIKKSWLENKHLLIKIFKEGKSNIPEFFDGWQ